ncbi:hypothetical protein SAMN02745166_00106 [Prosthecobacter debontii]|uniref:HYDIN/VesB/CFA65-like Ig-like domain-containing protein n=1 Tax=Prosthecobacter debontii TaxID=48467 RepID=A0A1T4WF75_9BACT|nr:choice-of-anchor D domain-containing protein [Prosthecobacter debontii]SKA75996.1 hypothetical protein SAMN02745166_00106 [Prosthecobacter debontii]
MRYLPFRNLWQILGAALLLAVFAGEASAAPIIGQSGNPAFGDVLMGSTLDRTFTITNTGDAVANINSVNVTGSGFALQGAAPTTVGASGGTATFTVRFSPTARQAYSGSVVITSPGSTGSPINISLSGTGVAPEIAVNQGATVLSSGSGTTNFTTVTLNGGPNTASSSLSFTITNSGTSDLSLTGNPNRVSIGGSHASDFSVTTQPAATVAANGGTSAFTVVFTPSARGTRTATLSIDNDDPDGGEDPFTINISGIGQAPEIALEQPSGTDIANNGSSNFGDVVVGDTVQQTFTIRNSGNMNLNLSGNPRVTVDGTHSVEFKLLTFPSAIVAGSGGTTTFVVEFTPGGLGTRTAALHITNDDPDGSETPFNISLSGNGTAPPTGTDGFGYVFNKIPATAMTLKETDPDVVNAGASLQGDDVAQVVNLGFSFSFYENVYTNCSVSTNGLITFGGSSTRYTPDLTFPNANAPDNLIAPFWTDLQTKAASKILYTTRGTTPNRVFILEFQNMAEYNNDSANVSFQVLLYEGSNAIEFQYKAFSGFSPSRSIGVGIEDSAHINGIAVPFPTSFPTAYKFSRPVIVKVESNYIQPGSATPVPVGTPSIGLNPGIGTTKEPYESTKRFEAPSYIYLSRSFAELPGAGDVNDPNPNNIAWYRLSNDGYAINGQTVQGARTFVEVTLNRDMTFVWRWELEYAVNIKFAGVGNPVPIAGRSWYKVNSPLTASVDTLVDSESTGVRLKTIGYQTTTYGPSGPGTPEQTLFADNPTLSVGTRSSTKPLTIVAPLEIDWLVSGQVRYRFNATSNVNGQADTPFDGLPFVRVYNGTATPVTTYGSGSTTDVWINVGADRPSKVEVGAFYRTADDAFTLTDFMTPPGGDLAPLGTDISGMEDLTIPERPPLTGSRKARVYTLSWGMTTRPSPTEIRWIYQPTIFRAEVPLGMPFDPTQTIPPLIRTVAPLTNRVLSDAGPVETSFQPVGDFPTGKKSAGAALRWDKVDLKLYPVHPSSNRLTWMDKNDQTKSYNIEIVSGYPGQTVNLTSERETADGTREGTAPLYVTQTTLPTIDVTNPGVGFPGQAGNAHYNHLFDTSVVRRPPTKLDLNQTDEWKFQEVSYTDNGTDGTATVADPGVPFTVASAGRSVLLYSYRPNPDEIADGNLSREKLAVRVIRSSLITQPQMVQADSSKLVLGRRALELGGGSTANRGAFGVVQPSSAGTANVDLGTSFLMDFWLNLKGLQDIPVTLTNCVTNGTDTVTCSSTSGLVAGMSISGATIATGTKIASITNATTFVLSEAANDSGTGLSLTAAGKPVTLLTTKNDKLKVTLDPEGPTITVSYFGATVTKAYPKAGSSWRHHVIHVFANQVPNGPQATVLDYYIDGVRDEEGFVTTTLKTLTDSASFDVTDTLTANSLRFGVDADPLSQLQMDQFRLFTNFPLSSSPASPVDPWLSTADVHQLRVIRRLDTGLRGSMPALWFNFDKDAKLGTSTALTNAFANSGTMANVTVGPVVDDVTAVYAGTLARVDIQEVATRLESTLDDAGFSGSGYILNEVSNYNPNIYNRAAEVGAWGTVYPVNANQVFTEANKRLEIAYYENPYRADRFSHPNVAWPYQVAAYTEMKFPAFGPHKDKAIYIASRIGSEGVDQQGRVQQIFSLDQYADLTIYNQPSRTLPGFNPNEEHALVSASGRAAVKLKNLGEDGANNPALAAFALQSDLNAKSSPYSSDPWVLIQVNNLVSGEPEMAAYQVFKTRAGTIDFPRPSDTTVTATPGLAYEAASTPEARFLITDKTKKFNFKYEFKYTAFAGDLLIPPYPLNIVIGNVAMADARGKSIQIGGVNQRTLWRDVNKNAWVVSGNGKFFHQFFYPLRADFYLPTSSPVGTPVAWVPDASGGVRNFTGVGSTLNPVKVVYDTFWRSDYPKLKRGETLTYQGGEYFAETPGANGLPALVAMKASELVYDSAMPSMVIGDTTTNRYAFADASARIIRPLDRREKAFTVANMGSAGFTPAANTKIFIVAERWYFKELPGSLQKRFYFDSLAQKLVFRGYLNDKDSGNKDLTVGPDPLNIVEPNVLTPGDYTLLRSLGTTSAWTSAIDDIYLLSQNPDGATGGNTSATAAIKNLQGFKSKPSDYSADLMEFWKEDLSGPATSPSPALVPLDSFGVGSALIPNQNLLTKAPTGSLYITIAENNRSELNGAPVSLHIVEIIPDRYRGAIKVIEAADAFSEKVSLQHNGEFGGNTGDLYYEWWIRDASSLDEVAGEVLADGTLKQYDANGNTLWQEYLPKERLENNSLSLAQKHYGLNSIVFEGRPDVVLADKLVLMRYRHKNESNWTLVPFEVANRVAAWQPGTPAPFQWAGAANSPQLQADGSKRYIPQLVMGWVKRVLDRINPYEARYTDFFSNESPATYSSQIQIAGAPYVGNVALNPDKNVIENTGLIELYMTVLNRAKALSIDNSSNGVASDGIKQAILLAATRLSVLYELLASEAYSDAQDSTINAGEDGSLMGIASYTHAFQNMEADLMHEELALLRGTDFLKSYPVYNRLFWNYAKGLGEAAYNVNYNIYDANSDGFINENDARKLYPQGHGDAWGHYLSAVGMHYTLLQHPGFSWKTRSELYSLMQNVLEVDYLDEKSFAKLAAAKARTGRDIVRDTYRLNYTQNPDGQWQGYTDGADPARAWGVSEWAHRAGQAAWFDCAVANAILPDQAAGNNPENLDLLERSAAEAEIGEIAGGLHEIQVAMDEANNGVNPLGFDSDALTFDIELQFYDNSSGGDRRSHFEQVLSRAQESAGGALAALEYATQAGNKLRSLGDDTEALIQEAMSQDLDFRNRLIEIFGRPYDGTIGFGKAYPEGYEGPDTLLFAYLDKTKINQIVPAIEVANSKTINFNMLVKQVTGAEIMNNAELVRLYNKMDNNGRTQAFQSLSRDAAEFYLGNQLTDLSLTYTTASRYGFQADPTWGQRTSYGTLQTALLDMLSDEIELDSAVATYVAYLGTFEEKIHRLQNELEINAQKERNKDVIVGIRAGFTSAIAAIDVGLAIANIVKKPVLITAKALEAALPTSIGFSNDVTSAARGAAAAASYAAVEAYSWVDQAATIAKTILELVRDEIIARKERDNEQLDSIREMEGIIEDIEGHMGSERPLRNAIGTALQNLETHRQAYVTAQAAGFRLLREREAFNKILAAKVQKNRYQDMIFRLSRNEAVSKYQTAFNNAARYAWLAARAYDYETSLDVGHPAAAGTLLDKIVKERQLGLWVDGEPQVANGGLAEILAQLKANFGVLKGQLGINNPQPETEQISLRSELFRIMSYDQEVYDAFDTAPAQRTPEQEALVTENPDALGSRARWQDAIKARIVPDLNKLPEFISHCRPVGTGVQPGIVIRFPTCIEPGRNFFGQQLAAGDHNYSSANFATKIQTFGVQLEHYTAAGLSISPRAYLVPVGNDYLRTSTSTTPVTRTWSIVEQRIPVPYTINLSNLSSPNYIPSLNGVDGVFGERRRHGDFRMYHDDGDEETLTASNRLIGRSVWNSEWLLIIPGIGLHYDANLGLQQFADSVSDIKLYFLTYSHTGQ